MSIRTERICDRCNVKGDDRKRVWLQLQVNCTPNPTLLRYTTMDLCDACEQSFVKWLGNHD